MQRACFLWCGLEHLSGTEMVYDSLVVKTHFKVVVG